MERAKFDTTYCVNDKCDKKCDRHASHYEFDNNKNYCWQMYCMEWLERNKNEKV